MLGRPCCIQRRMLRKVIANCNDPTVKMLDGNDIWYLPCQFLPVQNQESDVTQLHILRLWGQPGRRDSDAPTWSHCRTAARALHRTGCIFRDRDRPHGLEWPAGPRQPEWRVTWLKRNAVPGDERFRRNQIARYSTGLVVSVYRCLTHITAIEASQR